MIRKIRAKIQLVGLHAINPPRDPRGSIKLSTGDKLAFDMDPINFEFDPRAVNVYSVNNISLERTHIGHMATEFTAPIPNLHWGHYFQALMVNEVFGLPRDLADYISFEGECVEPTTHRPSGSAIYVFLSFDTDNVTEEVISAVAEYLRSAAMEVVRL